MRVKLIKTGKDYDLKIDGRTFATTDFKGIHAGANSATEHKLSIKNCQAIANGYDLDKLADEHCNKLYHEGNINWDHYRVHFKEGFKKALEILGDKKFSEEDMRIAYDAGASNIDGDGDPIDDVDMDFEGIIHSAQQTEWDVSVEMEDIIQLKLRSGDVSNMGKPKLDSNGCLILKRV